MKKIIVIAIVSISISFSLCAQSAGDYRSVANGNWSDATKWERYNGNNWVSATTYPGQNSGTGKVTIMTETEIKITETVPHPVNTLSVSIDDPNILPTGLLTFSAETAVSLTVSGDVIIAGELRVDNQNGAKTHELFIGRNLSAVSFHPINQDDKLGVTFNTTDPNSSIEGPQGISFHDITFNGIGIAVNTNIFITGNASFVNGVVRPGYKSVTNGMDLFDVFEIVFFDGATVSGGSNVSFIDRLASKSGVDPFTFPIGNEGFYAPLTISALAQPERIYAMYCRNGGVVQSPITDPELFSISNCESWGVFQDVSNIVNSTIDVTVGWTSATRCGSSYIANVSDVVLAHFDEYTWNSHGGTATGTNTNGSVTWSGFNFGGFTLGNVGTDCRIPSGLTTSNITANSATVSWSAVTDAVSYNVDYRQYNGSWINVTTATTSTAVNLLGLSPSVTYECRVSANCSSTSSSYRLTQFTTIQPPPQPVCNDIYETNNNSNQAKSIGLGTSISAIISSGADIDWFKITTPNNSNTRLEVALSNLPADYDLYVYNKNLALVGSSISTGTSNEVVIYNSNARKATYYIKVMGKNGAYNTSQCYNLIAQVNSNSGSTPSTSKSNNEIIEESTNQLLYPNPASEFVYLRFNSTIEGASDIQIFNTGGQLVRRYPVNITRGNNQIRIPVNDLRPGVYLLRINKGELSMIRKFVIAG